MTLATDSSISATEARELTDRLRASCAQTNALAARLPRRTSSATVHVYFVRSGSDGLIKIGSAIDVAARIRLLQTGSAEELHLLGTLVGSVAMEHRLHARFAHLRVRGEWFRPERDLLTLIEVLPR